MDSNPRIGERQADLSEHLRNRMEVAEVLRGGTASVTILRAAVILGSGSASYEIIQHLVKKIPLMLVPRWAMTKCQPIAVRDVVKYLVGVLETPETRGKSFDIGGSDVLTYRQMMEIFADLLGKRRLFLPCPFCNTRFFSYLASLLTPVPAARDSHTAVWTGTEMIVWGGLDDDFVFHYDGGRYDPLRDAWRPRTSCRFSRSVVIHRPVLTGVAPRRELNAGGGAR